MSSPPLTASALATLASYREAKILLTALKFDLFTQLVGAPQDSATLARNIGAQDGPLRVLLDALVALGVLGYDDEHYANTTLAAEHLVRGTRFWYWAQVEDAAWGDWSDLEATIRSGHRGQPNLYERDRAAAADLLVALSGRGWEAGELVADRVDLCNHRRVLDLGGGSGALSIRLCQRYPHLRATVVDLPDTLHVGRELVRQVGLAERIAFNGVDLRSAPLPLGYDVIIISQVLHWYPPAENRRLLRRVRAASGADALLLIGEYFLGPDRTHPAQAALFSVGMLVAGGGRCYTTREVTRWLEETGWQCIDTIEPHAWLAARA